MAKAGSRGASTRLPHRCCPAADGRIPQMAMLKTVDVSIARANFDELISSAARGDEVVIAKDERPIARLIPAPAPEGKRILGLGKGEVWISDDFDAPLPDAFWTGGQ